MNTISFHSCISLYVGYFILFCRYRHIDTAQSYENEQCIGQALRDVQYNNMCKRSELFLTTKLANYNMEPKAVLSSLEESLEKLKTKYVDMFLMHNPWPMKGHQNGGASHVEQDQYDLDVDFLDTWRAMEQLVKNGLTHSIGLSNCTEKQINSVLSIAKIVPQNVQLECHVYFQQSRLRSFLDSKDISCSAYSPLGAKDRPVRHKTPENENAVLLEDPVVRKVADKHGVSPAVVLLSLLLQLNMIVIPKTSTLSRLEENYMAQHFQLDVSDCEQLRALDRGLRFFTFPVYHSHPNFTKSKELF